MPDSQAANNNANKAESTPKPAKKTTPKIDNTPKSDLTHLPYITKPPSIQPEWCADPNQPIMVIDTETTGLDHKTEELIEIAGVRLENGEVVDKFTSLVKPTVPVRPSSFKIHHISEEMLADAPPVEEVLPKFMEFMGDRSFVAHNAVFDYSFLSAAHKKVFGKRWKVSKIDSLEMYRSVFPEDRSHGLSSLLDRFGFESHVSHRALDDAENLARVFPRLAELYRQKYTWQYSQFENIPYLLERYHRLQKTMSALQGEMGDLRDIFKLYFMQGGQPVLASNGEVLASQERRYYEYDDDRVWEILEGAGLVRRATKLNTRALDKMIGSDKVDSDIRQQLKDARTKIGANKFVQFIKPPPPEETHQANEQANDKPDSGNESEA